MEIERDGVRIHFEIVGDGPAVVLHTGGAGDGAMWREHLPHLTGFRLVLLDHRGRGRSGRPGTVAAHAPEQYVADVAAVLDALEIDRCGFVGYSLGSWVGYLLAASHPDRLYALAGLGVIRERRPDPAEAAADAAELRADGMAALVSAVHEWEGIDLPPWLERQFADTDAEQFALSMEGWSGWTPWPLLPAIRCPTLLIAGTEEDRDRRNGEAAAAIAGARAEWLEGLGHVGAFLDAAGQCALIRPHLTAAAGEPFSPGVPPAASP